MPELPEVETVRRGLQHLVTGYKITQAQQLHPRALKSESIAPLESLQGAKITGTIAVASSCGSRSTDHMYW